MRMTGSRQSQIDGMSYELLRRIQDGSRENPWLEGETGAYLEKRLGILSEIGSLHTPCHERGSRG